jgi:hypothetical protein
VDTIMMPNEALLSTLVTRARNGDKQAWGMLVERCAPIVWSICRAHGLSGQDADAVGQIVWLGLAERIGTVGEPAELPGWLADAERSCAPPSNVQPKHTHPVPRPHPATGRHRQNTGSSSRNVMLRYARPSARCRHGASPCSRC